MADPRANLFNVAACPAPGTAAKRNVNIARTTNNRREFFGSVGKIGDFAGGLGGFANSVGIAGAANGVSKIGQGLRTLASVSNSIRTGCGALPTSIGSSIDSGVNWVLENVNIAPPIVDAVRNFNPGIANQALGQAATIYNKVKQGNFKFTDVPFYLQDFQNLERLGRNIFTPQSWLDRNKFPKLCEASPYAMDLVQRAPKTKFLFIVEFKFNPGFETLATLNFPFVIKKSTRPNIRFEMEDVNYYNFRSKLIIKTAFEEMTMEFYDDNYNNIMNFMTAYMRASSPVTNMVNGSLMPTAGMSFEPFLEGRFEPQGQNGDNVISVPTQIASSASRGTFGNISNTQIIQSIDLYHLYDYGLFYNQFTFLNPRITQLNLDELDMALSDPAMASIVFNYDSVYVETNKSVQETFDKITQITNTGAYPLRPNFSRQAAQSRAITAAAPLANPNICGPQNTQNTSIPGVGPVIDGINGAVTTAGSVANSVVGAARSLLG